ncbi:MAG: hypothetical protein RG741_05935 [Bacteroidales bacterium]|nr:hypothetical protein [Bacteroidales bacterium]
MVYNLLFYGHYTSFCTEQNNNVDAKDEYLRTIISHTQPDIFAVNEMGPGQANADRLLNHVMNADGRTGYERASYTNTANSNLVNMLFFNGEKFALYGESVVANIVRDINLYTLFYRDEDLENGSDTVFLHILVTHMKAGSSAADQQRRMQEAVAVMGYIEQMNIRGNVLFMGDFNMNSSFEQAYQLITYHPNEDIRFFDPTDKPGVWWNNPDMAPYHTQSTRTGSHPCFVTGGMDDRYDLILATASIMQGLLGLHLVEGTYRAVGQDGQRFNQSLITPENLSEPHEVIMALYHMSDHLPVKMKMTVSEPLNTSFSAPDVSADLRVVLNRQTQTLQLHLSESYTGLSAEIISVHGNTLLSKNKTGWFGPGTLNMNISGVPPGVYVLRLTAKHSDAVVKKLMIY